MVKRNIIIAIMVTFCFTATMFLVIPIRSANQPYNPWIDYDENGAIGLTDLVSLANSYGTNGDPTKNVNVTNLPLDEQGNLRVSAQPQRKLLTLLKNETLSKDQVIELSANVTEYSYVYVWLDIESNSTDLNIVGHKFSKGTGDVWITFSGPSTLRTGVLEIDVPLNGPQMLFILQGIADEAVITLQIYCT